VYAFHLDDRAHRSCLLDGDLLNLAREFAPIIQSADQPSVTSDHAAVDGERLDQRRTRTRHPCLNFACIDLDSLRSLGHADRSAGTGSADREPIRSGAPATVAKPENLTDPSGQ